MDTSELRHIIAEHLSHNEDVSFLNAIKTIVEIRVLEGEYKLTEYQRKRIKAARQQLKEG